MDRRTFLRSAGATALLTASAPRLRANVPAHNFDKYDFGGGPAITDRLYQGPFAADQYPSWNVVMISTPSSEAVANYGMGLITYVCDEVGPPVKPGKPLADGIEDLVKLPLGSKPYIRVNCRDVQQRPGRLDVCEHWKLTPITSSTTSSMSGRTIFRCGTGTASGLTEFLTITRNIHMPSTNYLAASGTACAPRGSGVTWRTANTRTKTCRH